MPPASIKIFDKHAAARYNATESKFRGEGVFDMKKIFLPLMLMIFLLTSCGGDFKAKEKLVIGLDDDFAPMGFYNEHNELVGFDIDLARETGKRMGVDFEFRPIEWDKKKEALTSGKVDLIWNGLDITEERKEYMIFTKPYMDDRQIFLVRKDDNQNIHSEGDLAGKIVGTQAGSTAENYLNQAAELKSKVKEFKTYHKFNEAVDALKDAVIDVLICDEMIARYEMNTHPDQLEIIDVKTGLATEVAVGFRKEDVALRDKVQAAFNDMVKDGTAKKISERWFQADLIKSW